MFLIIWFGLFYFSITLEEVILEQLWKQNFITCWSIELQNGINFDHYLNYELRSSRFHVPNFIYPWQPIFCHSFVEGKWLHINVCSRFDTNDFYHIFLKFNNSLNLYYFTPNCWSVFVNEKSFAPLEHRYYIYFLEVGSIMRELDRLKWMGERKRKWSF